MTDAGGIIAAKSQDYVWDGMYSADMDEKPLIVVVVVVVDADALPRVVGELYPSGQIGCVFIKSQA